MSRKKNGKVGENWKSNCKMEQNKDYMTEKSFVCYQDKAKMR